MGRTLPPLHGSDSLFSKVKAPASMLVSSDCDLGSVETKHACQFFPYCAVSSCKLQRPLRGGEICGGVNLHLVAWSWKRQPDPVCALPLPRASSRENQSFCLVLGGHGLYFLFCIPSALETSLMFVSSLEKLKDNAYFILHSYLFGNELRHQKRQPPPPLQAAP